MRKPVVLGLLGLFTSLVPAFAGTVYVPVAPPQKIGDVIYRTQVVIGNPGGVARQLTTTFIASDRDGTRAGATPATATVPANGTLVLTNLTPAGRDGMLEISGAPELAVSARLEAVSRTGRILSSASLPVVGSDHVVPGGGAAQLQGIGRTTPGVQHRFGLLNLGLEEAACTVTAYRATGARVGKPVRFTVPALSHNPVVAPLAAFGSALFTEARVEVSCDSSFYAYAVQLSPEGAVVVSGPSATLESELIEARELLGAAQDLPRDDGFAGEDQGDHFGDEEEEGDASADESSAAAVVSADQLSFPGVFLNARKGNSYRTFDLPLSSGVRYKQVTVDFDLYLHKWVNPLFHGVMGLRRNDRTLYAGLILRGDRAKTILDLGKDELARDKHSGPWRQRSNFHIRITTDAQARRVTLQVFQGGRLVHTLAGPMTTPDLSVTGGRTMRVDFGGTKVADGAYFPPYGWKYSNLVVKAERF
jgi:hypothetical protein